MAEITESRQEAEVSVIIPCYRCADTIHRAVASVAAQSLRPKEVILVEDCSNDETLNTLYSLKNTYPEGWLQVIPLDENRGAGEARNAGWEAATQPFIAFLDADDSWHPSKIELQYLWMKSHPDVALTGHACELITQESYPSNIEANITGKLFKPINPSKLLMFNILPTPSVMLRRSLSQRFTMGKRYSEDYLLWNQICKGGTNCAYTSLPLTRLHKANYGESGLSSNLWAMEKGELHTYYSLFIEGRVNTSTIIFLYLWSFSKYLHRSMKILFRRSYY